MIGNSDAIDLLYGITDDGRKWTFLDLIDSGKALKNNTLLNKFTPKYIVEGGFVSPEALKNLKYFSASISGLSEWIGVVIPVELESDNLSLECKARTISEARIEKLDATIRISEFVTYALSQSELKAEAKTILEIFSEKPKSIFWADSVLLEILELIEFCCLAQLDIAEFSSEVNELRVKIHFGRRYKKQASKINFVAIPFYLVKDNLSETLTRWLSRTGETKRSVHIFTEYFLDKQLPVHYRFFSVMQALELFHRGKRNRDKGKNSYLINRLRELLNKDFPRSLHKNLTTDNQRFLELAKDTRNYLSHFNLDKTKNISVLDALDFYYANRALGKFFAAMICRKILKIPVRSIKKSLFRDALSKPILDLSILRPVKPKLKGGYTSRSLNRRDNY